MRIMMHNVYILLSSSFFSIGENTLSKSFSLSSVVFNEVKNNAV